MTETKSGADSVHTAAYRDVQPVPTLAILEPMYVGEVDGDFFVQAYQRGYRWGRDEVRRLLDDIWESTDQSYYLQPVVVKKMNDGRFELVDGQQRLTTLMLIFNYMRNENLQNASAPYSLEFETRPGSAAYLQHPDEAHSRDNIDFLHLFTAYCAIAVWFDSHGNRRQYAANKFYAKLFEQVKIIRYEAPPSVDSTTLFTRLNVGRIPLTDAELVKALLLSRVSDSVGGTDRTLEIAAQWDAIERDLHDPELWAYATGRVSGSPTRISLLLDLAADAASPPPKGQRRPLFHTFETLRSAIADDPTGFWNTISDRHSLLRGWFSDRDLAHRIGYLVALGDSLDELAAHAGFVRKTEFDEFLIARITARLNLTEEDLRELSYESAQTSRVLLLMNVEQVRTRSNSTERYSFAEHASGRWSLEHIHAQNAQDLNRADQWSAWLSLHREVLTGTTILDGHKRADLVAAIDQALALDPLTQADFRSVEQRIVTALSPTLDGADADVHSIANLALLAIGDNSALANAVFAVKRAQVLSRDRSGTYVPVCTRNVFLKYYSKQLDPQMHFWSVEDRRDYLDAMTALLRPYLKPSAREVTA